MSTLLYTVDTDGYLTVPDTCGWEGTYTWWPTDEGITLEMMPTDNTTLLQGDWDNSVIAFSTMVPVG